MTTTTDIAELVLNLILLSLGVWLACVTRLEKTCMMKGIEKSRHPRGPAAGVFQILLAELRNQCRFSN